VIENFPRETHANPVFKLASVPRQRIEAILLNRGINPDSIPEVRAVLAAVNVPVDAEEAVAYSFREPYGVGRFGDGGYPVFYSAMEEQTCISEVSHHHARQLEEQRSGNVPYDRYCHLIVVNFAGVALILTGATQNHPDLVSPTGAGYPFCRSLGAAAVAANIDALYTTSARAPDGTCVPVFNWSTLTEPQARSRFRFYAEGGETRHERLSNE
jgi:hypothetical protein